jgi:hypothetical protein
MNSNMMGSKNRLRFDDMMEIGAEQDDDDTEEGPCLGGKKKITTVLPEDDDHLKRYFDAFILFKQLLDMLVFHTVLQSGKIVPIMDPTCIWQVVLSAMTWSTTSTLVWLTVFLLAIRIRRVNIAITMMLSAAKGNSEIHLLLESLLDREKILKPKDILRCVIATKDGVIWIVYVLVNMGLQRDARLTRWTLFATLTLCIILRMMFVAFGKGKSRNNVLEWWIHVGTLTLAWIASEILVGLTMPELSSTARVVLAVVLMVMIDQVLVMVYSMKRDEEGTEEEEEEEGLMRTTTDTAFYLVLTDSTQSTVY